jgi:hypothetical protein
MMQLYLSFHRECHDVEDAQLRLSINCFLNNGLTLDEIRPTGSPLSGCPTPLSEHRPSIARRPRLSARAACCHTGLRVSPSTRQRSRRASTALFRSTVVSTGHNGWTEL